MNKTFLGFFFFLFYFVNIYGQKPSLAEIQQDLKNKKTLLSVHYNKLIPVYEKKVDSLILLKGYLESSYRKTLDSLNHIININQSVIDLNKTQLDNFKRLNQILENKVACIINTKKEKKKFIQLTKLNYPIQIFCREDIGTYLLISIDNEHGYRFDIKKVTNNKKASVIFKYLSENRLFSLLSTDLQLDLTKAKIPLDAELLIAQLNLKISLNNRLKEIELGKINDDLKSCDKNNIKEQRNNDSIRLSELFNYYSVIYPNELNDYNKLLSIERIKDKSLLETYNSALINYEKNVEYMGLNIETEADKCFSWLKTEFNDPYSAIFERFGLKTYPSITKKYPCAKIFLLTVRAKNGFGSYMPGKYLVVMIDGNPVTATEYKGNYEDETNLLINLLVKGGCKNSIVTEPTKPITAEERIQMPTMKEYNFKFSLN